MVINKICLENFRNYQNETIYVSPNVNVFYGNNAQGKTNILEAIYYTALGRSFRTYKDNELIRIGSDEAKIKVFFEKSNRDFDIDIFFHKDIKKTIKVNGVKLDKNSELLGNLNIVLFSPDDIIILKQSPAQRRKFLDVLISQLKPNYVHVLGEYNKVLDQRNALLKSKKVETIDVWDEQLASLAEKVFKYRREYLEKIRQKNRSNSSKVY